VIAVDSTAPFENRVPGYLVLEPESPNLREYVYFTGLSGSTFTGVQRGLGGSVSGPVAHVSGVKIRAVSMHQMFDDLWDGVEDDAADLQAHKDNPGDPHLDAGYLRTQTADTLYVKQVGDSMEGPLAMTANKITGVGDGTADQDAATKKQVDNGDANVTTAFQTADLTKLDKTGGTMSGDIAMGGSRITGLTDGVSQQDAATVNQLGSVGAPTHDGLQDAPASGAPWAEKHHTKYTDAEAVSAVGPHFAGSHAALSGVSANQHHTKYTDAQAVAAGAATYLPITNPNVTGTVRMANLQTLVVSAGYVKLQYNGTDVVSGDSVDELYISGVPHSNVQYDLRATDPGGGGRRVYYYDDSSTERAKHDIEPSPLEGGECLKWDAYQFRKDLEGDDGPVHQWTIAERIQEISGDDFVVRDDEGLVQNTDDRAMMADMFLTIQYLERRITELEAR